MMPDDFDKQLDTITVPMHRPTLAADIIDAAAHTPSLKQIFLILPRPWLTFAVILALGLMLGQQWPANHANTPSTSLADGWLNDDDTMEFFS